MPPPASSAPRATALSLCHVESCPQLSTIRVCDRYVAAEQAALAAYSPSAATGNQHM
ncbi:hypothetical protein PI125_g10801 [Phytophthora idaei]|nr:hypothetical protein PI125_g10801 [Phytophthora idaei]